MIKCKNKTISNTSKESIAKILKDILKNADEHKYLTKGDEGKIFYFRILKSLMINDFKIKPGEYVLKIFNRPKSFEQLNYYYVLSNLKLIPTIYIKNSKFLVMRYIDGVPLSSLDKFLKNTPLYSLEIYEKINQLIKKWHKLGFAHGDLNFSNILIGKSKINFIDPNIEDL